MILAPPSPDPNDCTYCRTRGPIGDTEPASARPKPSRIDFFPRSMTLWGISAYFVPTINSATDLVRAGAFGNPSTGSGDPQKRHLPSDRADRASELVSKSRRFMRATLSLPGT